MAALHAQLAAKDDKIDKIDIHSAEMTAVWNKVNYCLGMTNSLLLILGDQMATLSAQKAALNAQMADLGAQRADLGAQRAALDAQNNEMRKD